MIKGFANSKNKSKIINQINKLLNIVETRSLRIKSLDSSAQ